MNPGRRGSLPERVPPSLLDRLTSTEPGRPLTDARRGEGAWESVPGTERGIRAAEYRDTVMRDLEWLFNATPPLGLLTPAEIKRWPQASKSVLNFGLRTLFGEVVQDLDQIGAQVAAAVACFEPRLLVERHNFELSQEGQVVRIMIEGTLLTQREKRTVVVRTDLETLASRLTIANHG